CLTRNAVLTITYTKEMYRWPVKVRRIAGSCLLGALLLYAQDWQNAAVLPGVDMAGLTAAQKTSALTALRTQVCSSGCGMKVAECRIKDPTCSFSTGLASTIVGAIKKGKTRAGAIAEAKASKFAHAPVGKVLESAVLIPTAGAPSMGPADARITLVEFSD